EAQGTDRASPPHIGTRWRCSVLLCSQARAEPAELARHGWTHQLDRYSIDTLSEGLSSAAAPRLQLQEQATPLQQGLMALQPSSLRTSFPALSITRREIKESVIYEAEGDRD